MLKRLFRKPKSDTAPEPATVLVAPNTGYPPATEPTTTAANVDVTYDDLPAANNQEPPVAKEDIDYSGPDKTVASGEDDVQVFKDKAGEYRWRRVSANHVDIVSESGEGYKKLAYAMEQAGKLNPGIEPRFVLGENKV